MNKVNIRGHKIKHVPKGIDALIKDARVQSYVGIGGVTLYLCHFRNVLELLCNRAGYPIDGMDIIPTASGLKWRIQVGNGKKLY